MDNLDLSPFFKTKLQANDFTNRLATVVEALYKTDFHLENALMDQFGIEKKDKFMALLRENNVAPDSVPALKAFMTKMQEKIPTIPVLPIVLAFEPKSQTLDTLTDWFELNLKRQVVFDIKVDKNLIGGAAITYNGKYMDFSIRSVFEETVKNALTKRAEQHAAPPAPTPVTHQQVEHIHLGR